MAISRVAVPASRQVHARQMPNSFCRSQMRSRRRRTPSQNNCGTVSPLSGFSLRGGRTRMFQRLLMSTA